MIGGFSQGMVGNSGGGGGGGVNPGTAGTLTKYDPAGTNVVDSQIREGSSFLWMGPANSSRLLQQWTANNSALVWYDNNGNTPFAAYQNYSNLQVMFLGVSPSLGNYSQIAFTYGGSISTHGIYFYIQGGIQQFAVVPDGIETGNINTERMIWSQSLATLRLTHRVFGTMLTLDASTGDITSAALAGNPTNHAIVTDSSGKISRANGQTFYPYTAAGGTWVNPKPTNVHEAIDRLAAAVRGLLGNDIP